MDSARIFTKMSLDEELVTLRCYASLSKLRNAGLHDSMSSVELNFVCAADSFNSNFQVWILSWEGPASCWDGWGSLSLTSAEIEWLVLIVLMCDMNLHFFLPGDQTTADVLVGASGGLQNRLQACSGRGLGRLQPTKAKSGHDDWVCAQAGLEGPPPTLPKTWVSAERLCDGAALASCWSFAEAGQKPKPGTGTACFSCHPLSTYKGIAKPSALKERNHENLFAGVHPKLAGRPWQALWGGKAGRKQQPMFNQRYKIQILQNRWRRCWATWKWTTLGASLSPGSSLASTSIRSSNCLWKQIAHFL